MSSQVSIARLLAPDRILAGLKAKTYRDAVVQLLDRLDAAGLISDRAAVEELVDAEIAAGALPTLGPHALLAHYRTDAVQELAVAIATSPRPFAFAPPKAAEAVFVVLILVPRSAARYYLKTLAGLSRLLRNPEVAEGLARATSPDEFLELVTQRDVVIRPELTVHDLMSRDVHSVSPEALLSEALHLMVRHRRRGLPVLSDNGEVLGMISEQEVLQHFLPQVLGGATREGEQPEIEDVEVRYAMQRSVMCLSEDQLISDVLGTMLTESVSQFPVVREGKLVGFLSRTDIIRKLLEHSV
ncbi:MAG: CBS domain-containing protein [Gemmatimonadota bacterium]|nr:MAG: CBS domain-containing protein [Gemmatimonadota bacterium]